MALTASAGSGGESSFEQVPPGSYKAICYRLVDAGTAEEEYQGEVNKRHRLYIFWELPEMKTEDDRPMSIFAGYTLSLNERSNLFRDLCAWRNAPFSEEEKALFDLTSLLGKGCKLNIGTTANGNARSRQSTRCQLRSMTTNNCVICQLITSRPCLTSRNTA